MTHYLSELVHLLNERKIQAYARKDATRVALIEARLNDIARRYDFKRVAKACPVLWQGSQAAQELLQLRVLAFQHPIPEAGCQLVKGTIESQEPPEQAAHRELYEESGLSEPDDYRNLMYLGRLHHLIAGEGQEQGPLELQDWEIFGAPANHRVPESWNHTASGSPEENGLDFSFFWQTLSPQFLARMDTNYAPIFMQVMHYVWQVYSRLHPQEQAG